MRKLLTLLTFAFGFSAAEGCGALRKTSALMLHPVTVEAAKPQAPVLPETPPKKPRKENSQMAETTVELTDAGKALTRKYAARLAELQAEIGKELPAVSEAQKQAYDPTRRRGRETAAIRQLTTPAPLLSRASLRSVKA